MKDWEVRQQVFHRLNRFHPDQVTDERVEYMSDWSDDALVERIVEYFAVAPSKVVYPAKSYLVAIVYARLLSHFFKEDFYVALDSANLLYGNDPYFKRYSDHKHVYDAVLERIGLDFDMSASEIPDVQDYFLEEFQIESDPGNVE